MKHGRADYDERIQDAANIIPADEPVFLLRGQDRWAARVVRYYADLLENAGASDEHVASVLSHALSIQNWRPKKLPDRINEKAESIPAEPESDDAYRARLMTIAGPGSVNYKVLQTADPFQLDEIGSWYEGGERK